MSETVSSLTRQLEESVWNAHGAEIRSLKMTLARMLTAQTDTLYLLAKLETRIEKLERLALVVADDSDPYPADAPFEPFR